MQLTRFSFALSCSSVKFNASFVSATANATEHFAKSAAKSVSFAKLSKISVSHGDEVHIALSYSPIVHPTVNNWIVHAVGHRWREGRRRRRKYRCIDSSRNKVTCHSHQHLPTK